MPYAEGRTFLDADSHVMELPGWLEEYADPQIRERIRPLHLGAAGKLADKAIADAESRRGDERAAAKLEDELMSKKGWSGLGAFDRAERSRALDLLGFQQQLVFSTFAGTQYLSKDTDLLFGGTTAHNRAMVDFCGDDERLLAVAAIPWGPPAETATATVEAIELGAAAILVPTLPDKGGLSPTHPDYDGVWRAMAERNVPFMVHIGGGGPAVRPVFHNNGKQVTDFLGGGENVRSKDYVGVSHTAEVFLAALILDGVFDRFPALRGGCIELGAVWVPGWMTKLDLAQRTFGRTEPDLANLELKPSEYAHRNLWFTPFPSEPVGWLIEQAGDDLFLFSSDYPHPEGGRDPLMRFEETLTATDESAKEKFYAGNFASMMG